MPDKVKITSVKCQAADDIEFTDAVPANFSLLQDVLLEEAKRLNLTIAIFMRPDAHKDTPDSEGQFSITASVAARSGFLPVCITSKMAELFFTGTATPLNTMALYSMMDDAISVLESDDTTDDLTGQLKRLLHRIKSSDIPPEDRKQLKPILKMLHKDELQWLN